MEKLFGLKEKILLLVVLTILNIFALVISILIIVNLETDYIVLEIILTSFMFLGMALSFLTLAFKDLEIRKKVLIVNILFFLGLAICTFIFLFANPIEILTLFFCLISGLINIIITIISSSIISNLNENKTNQETNSEETILQDEINKLKAKLRIKNLESEYLKLKSELEEK